MEKYSAEWKVEQQAKKGGWPQKHGDTWKWHYIAMGTEFSKGSYLSRKDCEEENKA